VCNACDSTARTRRRGSICSRTSRSSGRRRGTVTNRVRGGPGVDGACTPRVQAHGYSRPHSATPGTLLPPRNPTHRKRAPPPRRGRPACRAPHTAPASAPQQTLQMPAVPAADGTGNTKTGGRRNGASSRAQHATRATWPLGVERQSARGARCGEAVRMCRHPRRQRVRAAGQPG
jgi:hypothetical protein